MNNIEYFKLQTENLFNDYLTKVPYIDEVDGYTYYNYTPKYFDIDEIICSYDIDEEEFSLISAQDVIAHTVGFETWSDLLKASKEELELARLVFDNQDKINIDEWDMYIGNAEEDNQTTFSTESKIEIFKHVFLNVKGHRSMFPDFRLSKKNSYIL